MACSHSVNLSKIFFKISFNFLYSQMVSILILLNESYKFRFVFWEIMLDLLDLSSKRIHFILSLNFAFFGKYCVW